MEQSIWSYWCKRMGRKRFFSPSLLIETKIMFFFPFLNGKKCFFLLLFVFFSFCFLFLFVFFSCGFSFSFFCPCFVSFFFFFIFHFFSFSFSFFFFFFLTWYFQVSKPQICSTYPKPITRIQNRYYTKKRKEVGLQSISVVTTKPVDGWNKLTSTERPKSISFNPFVYHQ